MKHRNTKFSALAALVLPLGFPGGAMAFQVPTIDMSSLAQLKTNVTTNANQLVELNQIKSLNQQQLDAIGQFGPLGSLMSGTSLGNVGSQSDFYSNMQKFAFDPCAINLCQSGTETITGSTDLDEAKTWVLKNFFAGDVLIPEQERDLREIRRRGVINASVNAFALSTITHNDLAGAGQQADALDQIVSASQDLRGDIRANSAIALASYKVELQQLATLASLLEVQSMQNIKDSQIYHELGGTKFADAHIDDDFAKDDKTRRINVTPPKQGASTGSGLGGALIKSLGGGSSVDNILSANGLSLPGDIGGLAAAVKSGEMPSIDPSTVTLRSVSADSVSVAQSAIPESNTALKSSFSQIQDGLAKAGEVGNAKVMMGVAQTYASISGDTSLSAALNTGSLAMDANTADAAISFAKGIKRDLAQNGVVGQYSDYLDGQIAQIENGASQPRSLILDAATLYATLGSDANAKASDILKLDPTSLNEDALRNQIADAIETVAAASGNNDLLKTAGALRSVNQDQIDTLRVTLEQAQNTDRAQ